MRLRSNQEGDNVRLGVDKGGRDLFRPRFEAFVAENSSHDDGEPGYFSRSFGTEEDPADDGGLPTVPPPW